MMKIKYIGEHMFLGFFLLEVYKRGGQLVGLLGCRVVDKKVMGYNVRRGSIWVNP
jgi:hypothetical protein